LIRFMQDPVFITVAGDANAAADFLHLLLHHAPVGIVIAVKIDAFGLGFVDEFFQLGIRLAAAQNEPAGGGLQIFAEGIQAVAKKLLPYGTCPAVVLAPAAQDVNGNDLG